MSLILNRDGGSDTASITGDMHLANAAACKELFLEAIGSCRSLTVSLRVDAELDVAALQLLFAAEREAGSAGVIYRYEPHTEEAVTAAMEQAGMARPERRIETL